MFSIDDLYAAAANAGLLTPVVFRGTPAMADFRLPDETVLDGLALSADPRLRFLLSSLPGLAAGDEIEVAGARWRVRSLKAIGDGSEAEAALSRL